MRKYEREAHVGDDLAARRRAARRPRRAAASPQRCAGALEGEVLEVGGVVGEALGDRERRAAAACRTRSSTSARSAIHSVLSHASGTSRNRWRISAAGLQVVLVALELEALRVAHQRAGLHAQQGVVGHVVVAVGVVAVVGGQQRRADACGRSRAAAGWSGAARGCRGPAARRTGCRAPKMSCSRAALLERARPRRPAAAPAARGRRGSRWWR